MAIMASLAVIISALQGWQPCWAQPYTYIVCIAAAGRQRLQVGLQNSVSSNLACSDCVARPYGNSVNKARPRQRVEVARQAIYVDSSVLARL